MLRKWEKYIAVRNLQIFYVFVLRAEVLTTFGSKVVIFSVLVADQWESPLFSFKVFHFVS